MPTVTDAQGQVHQFPDEATPEMMAGALGVKPPAAAPYKYSFFPLSEDAQGNTSFDPSVGVMGAVGKAASAPGDVYTGKLDPTSPEGQQRATDFAMTFVPGSAAMRAGERAITGEAMSARRALAPTPTADQLKTAAGTAYDAARATGAEYPGQAISDMASGAQRTLDTDGILSELAPQTHAVLNRLQNPPAGATVTIASLDAARKALGRIGGNFQNPTEQEASRRVIKLIDQHIQDAGSGTVPPAESTSTDLSFPAPGSAAGAANGAGVGGAAEDPLTQAARLIREARGNAAAAFRSNRITDAEEAAANRTAATNSGQNGGNAIRQRVASILNSDKASRGYSADELDAMQQVVRGTATGNTLRRVSNLLGGGGGLGQTAISGIGAGLGYALGHSGEAAGAGAAALPIVGSAARSAYNALVARQIEGVAELIRQRSPLYQQSQGGLLPMLRDRATGLLGRGDLLGRNPDNEPRIEITRPRRP